MYADIIQGVGAVPFDVRASGVDFAAAGSFKWLMGDFGLGFLYVRADLIERVLKRTTFGYDSSPDIVTHFLPSDAPGAPPFAWEFGTGASSTYEVGSRAAAALMALDASLPYLRRLGVERIQAWRQPLLQSAADRTGPAGLHPGDAARHHVADPELHLSGGTASGRAAQGGPGSMPGSGPRTCGSPRRSSTTRPTWAGSSRRWPRRPRGPQF